MGEKMDLRTNIKVDQKWGKMGVFGSKRDEKVAKQPIFSLKVGH